MPRIPPDATEDQLRQMCRQGGIADSGNKEDMVFWLTATAAQLKERCAERGLPVSGNKKKLIERLANPDAVRRTSVGRGSGRTLKSVDAQLAGLGLQPELLSACAKAGIARGYLPLHGAESLDEVVFESECEECGAPAKATLRQCLQQPDQDTSYDEEEAAIICTSESCGARRTLSGMCDGRMEMTCGKFHNHCRLCKGFGRCIGDVRNAHCLRCNAHFFIGSGGSFPCERCGHREGYSDEEEEDEDDVAYFMPPVVLGGRRGGARRGRGRPDDCCVQ